ncbi:MAG: HEPN domain-containing protein [Candidatus Sumerlaeia bacterium]|nr:HEPN domain-containing protein [Candidatus Sumerlaeia bacterium]
MDDQTKELARLWLLKAKHDLIAARKSASGEDAVLDVAIYHCQQAAEKALKALMVAHDIPFEKMHDIKALLAQVLDIAPSLSEYMERADYLTDYATEYRYPGEELAPSAEEFCQALQDAESIFELVLARLPEMHLD